MRRAAWGRGSVELCCSPSDRKLMLMEVPIPARKKTDWSLHIVVVRLVSRLHLLMIGQDASQFKVFHYL